MKVTLLFCKFQFFLQYFRNIQENTKGNHLYDPTQDPVLNEFKRENLIHRQAQAAVIDGIKRLKELNIPTRR